MIRLLGRKVLILLILLPLLNAIGFHYARAHPRFIASVGYSLNQLRSAPPPRSYADYLRGVWRGDWGSVDNASIATMVGEPLRCSLQLLLIALGITVIAGPLLGVLSVSARGKRLRPGAVVFSLLGLSMPGFFLGVVVLGAMLYLTLYAGRSNTPLPLSGYGLDKHLILPVLVLASRPVFHVARITSGLLEHELQQDYVRVAESKGLGRWRLVWGHAFPNILSAVVAALGQSARLLISALIIVETLFLWPGIGRLMLLDLGIRTDGRPPSGYFAHPELLAMLAMIFGALLLLADLIASLAAHVSDPRLRAAGREREEGAR